MGLRRLAAVAVVLLAAFGVGYFVFRGPRDDLGRFQGEWQVAVPSGARDGKPVANVKPVVIRVTGDRWVFVAAEKEKRYAMTLRPEANPKEIDLVELDAKDKPTERALRGIYTLDGDRAKVVLGEPRPAKLDDPDGPPGILLERVN